MCDIPSCMQCWHTSSVITDYRLLWGLCGSSMIATGNGIACSLYQQHCCKHALRHCRCFTVVILCVQPTPRLHAGSSPVLKSPVGHEGAANLRDGRATTWHWQGVAWVVWQCFIQREAGRRFIIILYVASLVTVFGTRGASGCCQQCFAVCTLQLH